MRKQMDEEQLEYRRVITAYMRSAPCKGYVVLCPVVASWTEKTK